VKIAYPFGEHLGYDRARFFQTVRTVSGLAAAGCRVAFIVGRMEGLDTRLAQLGLERGPNLEVVPVTMRQPGPDEKLRWSSNRIFFRSTVKALVNIDVDIVLGRHAKLLNYLIKKRTKNLMIYELHELSWRTTRDAGAPEKTWRKIRKREENVCRKAAGLVCTSPGLAKYVRDEMAVKAPILVAPNPVPDSFFAVKRQPDPAQRRVVYAGQFFPWKGVDTLVQAMVYTENARLVLLGGEEGTEDWKRIVNLVDRLNLTSRVELKGFTPQVRVIDELSRATVGVVPAPAGDEMSRDFTSPLKLFEYLAAGTPVIATDVPAINQLVRHNHEVLLSPPDDARAMATCINTLLEDQKLGERLSHRGREWARSYTSLERGRKLMAFFKQITENRVS
jgi:glycosyltransferase involved in cell wall biosynthesis